MIRIITNSTIVVICIIIIIIWFRFKLLSFDINISSLIITFTNDHETSTVQYSTVQYSTVQYSTVQYSTVQYSTVQYSTAGDFHFLILQFDRSNKSKIFSVNFHLCSRYILFQSLRDTLTVIKSFFYVFFKISVLHSS